MKKTDHIKKNDVLFFILMMLVPIVQMSIFYIGVNINSVLLVFKSYDLETGSYSYVFLDNFKQVFKDLFTSPIFLIGFKNSIIVCVCTLVISYPLGLLFSYALYKKCFGYKLFKIVLFIPQIVSVIVLTTMFNYFVEKAIPEVLNILSNTESMGLFSNSSTTFGTLIFYLIWTSFGTSMLMYVGAMNSIDISVIEACKLDGAGPLQEFIKVIFPSIFSTVLVFLTVTIVGIFSQQLNLFSFFGTAAETRLYTIGYYLYREVKVATKFNYPYLSTLGVIFTIVAAVISLLFKYLMEKFGPSDN